MNDVREQIPPKGFDARLYRAIRAKVMQKNVMTLVFRGVFLSIFTCLGLAFKVLIKRR